jgi:mannose-6-phosphate isomerase-like protein (cupin superfamily)
MTLTDELRRQDGTTFPQGCDSFATALTTEMDIGDKSITKVSAATAPRGPMGQKYLASGIRLCMRLWEKESPDIEPNAETEANYETVGYVISGRAEIYIEGQVVDLEPWIVPKGSRHSYKIVEAFTALEATTPPAEVHARDRSEPAG